MAFGSAIGGPDTTTFGGDMYPVGDVDEASADLSEETSTGCMCFSIWHDHPNAW